MNDIDILKLFDPLYSDISKEEAFDKRKPLLAHYTSIEVIERILGSNEVWFSNPLFMNDLEEVRAGLFEGVPLALNDRAIDTAWRSSNRVQAFKNAFNGYFHQFANEHIMDTYVFCLSEHDRSDHDGLLSMWRGYGGNGKGAAIVIDTAKFNAIPGSPFIIAKVEYASRERKTEWHKTILTQFAKIVVETTIPDEKIFLAAYALFQRMKLGRSGDIRRIYEESAPPISSAMKPPAREFLTEVVNIVKRGVDNAGGHFEVPKAAE
jgi:Protein of unknown function (DUF2971)